MSATAFFFYFIFKNVFIYHLIFPILFIQFFFFKSNRENQRIVDRVFVYTSFQDVNIRELFLVKYKATIMVTPVRTRFNSNDLQGLLTNHYSGRYLCFYTL